LFSINPELVKSILSGYGEANLVLDMRITSKAFYWFELETELRERKMEWKFKGNVEQTMDDLIHHIDTLRRGELYPHSPQDCSDLCKKRG